MHSRQSLLTPTRKAKLKSDLRECNRYRQIKKFPYSVSFPHYKLSVCLSWMQLSMQQSLFRVHIFYI